MDVVDPNAEAGIPAYERIRSRIHTAILSGALSAGTRLPSSRTLADDFGVSRNTVDTALDQLVAQGYLVRRRGAGSFVIDRLPEADAPPLLRKHASSPGSHTAWPRLSDRAAALEKYPGHKHPASAKAFTPSLPPIDLFPRKVWNRLLNREAGKVGNRYWEYGASNGLPALREAIAAHASAMRATRCSPDQVSIVTSTQQAVELAAKVLADPGAVAWVEHPGYQPVRYCLRSAGVQTVEVPVDEEGLRVRVGRRLAPDARLACVTPSHQYPMGVEMSVERRTALLDWAAEADAFILEDDYDGDYRYEGRPIASLQGMQSLDRVIYVASFNKIMFPALRIAYAIVPEPLIDPFLDAKHVADGHTALLSQGVLAAFITEGHLAAHLRRTRAVYSERRLAFLEEARALDDMLAFGPARAGMHVAAVFRDPIAAAIDDRDVCDACARAGVVVHPLSKYGAAPPGGLVFGFASADRAATRAGLEIVHQSISGARRK